MKFPALRRGRFHALAVSATGLLLLAGLPAGEPTDGRVIDTPPGVADAPRITSSRPTPATGSDAVSTPEPALVDSRKLTKAIRKSVPGTHLSVSVRDLSTGASYTYGGSRRFATASIVKVDILATLLLRAQQAGHGLTATQRDLAARMIKNSDNAAADSLWAAIGGPSGLTRANKKLGLRETVAASGASWGVTRTSSRDQVRLLYALNSPKSPLNARNRAYVRALMSSVSDDQDWGISAGAGAGDSVALKNGWLPRSIDGGLWVINSIGRIRHDDHEFLIAVLSDHNASMPAGVRAVEKVAQVVIKALPLTGREPPVK